MLIELVDALRCPSSHAEAHLVASVADRRGRRVWTGALGCPVCRAEYPIVRGVAHFGVVPDCTAVASMQPVVDETEVDRAAALLHLDEPGGLVLLSGPWAAFALELLERCHAHYVLLDPPFDDDEGAEVSPLRVAGRLPFGPGVFRAVALDESLDDPTAAAARFTAPRGRAVLPAGVVLPAELRYLAADARHVVAERELEASAPVSLRRRAPFTD
jgi:uncharacterized protein YbaR (Trm112 family)